ncbi:MAG: right-handed parallel beta-helix repeat-containing protein [Chloroflexi bacterium]|nr:right-handed parallel beta-helix repeat-containing protein [Chloroflexota bacterium]
MPGINGDPGAGRFVRNVHFRNLRFFYTNYTIEPQGHSDGQAAVSVPAALQFTGATSCSVENCEIAHTANYGIWLRAGCQDDRIVHSELYDLGAGGVRIGETGNPAAPQEAAGNNTADNNFIHDDGRIFRGAVGVFIARSSGNTVSHNDIGDTDYTGISVGWSWGYDPSSANHNILEYNHIHDIGRGELSDMGAIYSLGVSPGTIERGNVMHDIYCNPAGYGGWGVYTDEGSSGILVENNLVFNTSSGCFHQHYGENNVLENNIFAYGVAGVLQRTREETHNSFTFEHNLVISNGSPFQVIGWNNGYFTIDHNLYWNYRETSPRFFGMTLADWQSKGHDTHSIVADPRFTGGPPKPNDRVLIGANRSDFDLRPGSPAAAVGFVPFDTSRAGVSTARRTGRNDPAASAAAVITRRRLNRPRRSATASKIRPRVPAPTEPQRWRKEKGTASG